MNRKEWKELCKVDKVRAHRWYNKVRKLLLSKEFEFDERTDKDARVIHHLIETEEQRKYNDEHYERFGFEVDENGNESFTYGKYVVFWTKEHHSEYHHGSEETRKKRSESLKGCVVSEETKRKIGDANRGKKHTDESRQKMSKALKGRYTGVNSPNYGRKHTEETRLRMHEAHVGKLLSEEHKLNISKSLKQNPPWLGKHLSDETKKKISENNAKPMLGKHHTEESKKKMSEAHSGEKNPMYGKRGQLCPNYGRKGELSPLFGRKMSDEFCNKIKSFRQFMSSLYRDYKYNNGDLTWNEFNSALKLYSENIETLQDVFIKGYVLKLIAYKDEPNRPRAEKQMKTNYLHVDREEIE